MDRGYDEGATVVVDGRHGFDGDRFFLGASLLDHVTPEMDVYHDDIFGQVLSVVRAHLLRQAVRLVDEDPYGNGTAIFTATAAGGTASSSTCRRESSV